MRLRRIPWLWLNMMACAIWLVYIVFVRTPAQEKDCVGNLSKVLLGLQIYSLDNDDRLPLSESWADATLAYVDKKSDFRCAMLNTRDTDQYGHAFNSQLSGKRIEEVRPDKTMPILFDSRSTRWGAFGGMNLLPESPRNGKGHGVAFIVGAALVPRSELPGVLDRPVP